MKRSTGGVRKKNGKWTIRYRDVHDEPKEKTLEVRTRAEALAKRVRILALIEDQRMGINAGDPDTTFDEVWVKQVPVLSKKGGWRTYEMYWRVHIRPAFGEKKLRRVSRSELRSFLDEKTAEGLAPRTVDHIRIRLGALYTFAAEEGIYKGENIASAVGALEVPEAEPRALPFEIVQAVIDSVPPEWRNFFAVAVYTGLRSGELRALKPESVSADRRLLRVSRSGSRAVTKTNKSRQSFIPAACQSYMKSALDEAKGRAWLFTTPGGEQLPHHIRPADILRDAMESLGLISTWTAACQAGCRTRETLKERTTWRCPKCGKAGRVKPDSPFVFHDLRKTWETYMHEVVNDPMAVFQMAGHSPEVAMRRYIAQTASRTGAKADLLDFKRLSPSHPSSTQEVPGTDVQDAEFAVVQPMENVSEGGAT